MEPNIQEAVAVLKKFIIAMNKWEVYYCTLSMDYVDKGEYEKLNSLRPKKREELNAIYNTYLTLRERKYGRQSSLRVGYPAEYSPDEEILATEVLKKNKIAIETQDHSILEYRYRYTLHYKNKEWRIDKKEVYRDEDDKWEILPL
ncbi:NTF2 fold immunity protein [Gilliamella apicola]|nr:NTF2 fold immunity protein [Gilliamella apicola]